MIVGPYAEAQHYPLLAQWWVGHGVPALPPRWLSPLGMLAWDAPEGQPLGACFLYLSGTAVCWIENLVSNPGAAKRAQARALDAVVVELLRIARETGHDVVACNTDRLHVMRRARRHGFQAQQGQVLLCKAL